MGALIAYDQYNALPPMEQLSDFSNSPDIEAFINGPISDVFIKHAAHSTLCLYFQHRHNTLGLGQAIAKINGSSNCFTTELLDQMTAFGNMLAPTTWMTSDGEIMPMEYEIVPTGTSPVIPSPEFVAEFLQVLSANKFGGMFGLDTKAEHDWVEFQIGDASVVVPNNGVDIQYNDGWQPVTLEIRPNAPYKVHGRCVRGQQKHSSKPTKPK